MELKIKKEWVDKTISCPLRGIIIDVFTIEKELYPFLYNKGCQFLFETPTDTKPTIKQTKPTDNDILD